MAKKTRKKNVHTVTLSEAGEKFVAAEQIRTNQFLCDIVAACVDAVATSKKYTMDKRIPSYIKRAEEAQARRFARIQAKAGGAVKKAAAKSKGVRKPEQASA